MNAIAYYRYSSHKQGEQSIEGQAREAQRWAQANGYTIIREYADRAATGTNDEREQFQLMLHELEKLRPEVLILWKVDRMGRNKEEIVFNKYKCKKAGVKIVYTAENIPDSPEGVILESIMEGMAEYYSLQMSQNIRRGMALSAQKGQSLGGMRSLGYITGPDKKLQIEPVEAASVREIFRLCVNGFSQSEIVREMNKRGAKTARGRAFTRNSVRSVLQNERYTGVYKYKDIRVEGGQPAIIDRKTFDAAQAKLKHNQRTKRHHADRADFFLSGKLFCGHCGAKMIGISGKGRSGVVYHYYSCSNNQHGKTCRKKNVPKEFIEACVLECISRLLNDEKLLTQIARDVYEYYIADCGDAEHIAALEASARDTDKSIQNILAAIEQGIFTPRTKARLEELERQLTEINESISREQSRSKKRLTEDQILFALTQFRKADPKTVEGKKRLIETFINAIFLYDDKIVLTFNYSGDNRTVELQDVEGKMVCASGVNVHQFEKPLSLFDLRALIIFHNTKVLYQKCKFNRT